MKQLLILFLLCISLSSLAHQRNDNQFGYSDSVFRAKKKIIKDSLLTIAAKNYIAHEKVWEASLLSKQMSLKKYKMKTDDFIDYFYSLDFILDDYAHHCTKKKTGSNYDSKNMLDSLFRQFIEAVLRFDVESAEKYLEKRVVLDSTNIVKMLQACQFSYNFTFDYEKAGYFLQKALKTLEADTLSANAGVVYACLSALNNTRGDSIAALAYQKKAWDIFSVDPKDIEDYQHNGILYTSHHNYKEISAIEKCFYYIIDEYSSLKKENKEKAKMYNDIGSIMYNRKNYSHASDYFFEAYKLSQRIEKDGIQSAFYLYNYGVANYQMYIYYVNIFMEALRMFRKNFDDYSEYIQGCYRFIDIIYRINIKYLDATTDINNYQIFLSDKIFVMLPPNEDVSSRGVKNPREETIILELGQWCWDCHSSIFDPDVIPKELPTKIVVLKDNKISQSHLENITDLNIIMRSISDKEKNELLKRYAKWKKNHK